MSIKQNKQLTFLDKESEIINPAECKTKIKVANSIYIDGASRNNPGPAGAGFSLKSGDQAVCEQGFFVGHRTNNQAEYFALLLGLYFAKEYLDKNETLLVFSDSQLLVRQMTGIYKIRDPLLQKMRTVAVQLMQDYKVSFCHVYRENNERADFLANRGIDKLVPMPKRFVDMLHKHDVA